MAAMFYVLGRCNKTKARDIVLTRSASGIVRLNYFKIDRRLMGRRQRNLKCRRREKLLNFGALLTGTRFTATSSIEGNNHTGPNRFNFRLEMTKHPGESPQNG